MQQLQLFKNTHLKYHGGEINKRKRKTRRPLATDQPIHLVLKSNTSFNLFKEFETVKYYINKYSFQFHIRIYKLSIQKDHIHLLIKIDDRDSYKKLSRSLTGILARKYGKGIWKLSPFSRVLSWGKDFQTLKKYIEQNEDEIWGVKAYRMRKKRGYPTT